MAQKPHLPTLLRRPRLPLPPVSGRGHPRANGGSLGERLPLLLAGGRVCDGGPGRAVRDEAAAGAGREEAGEGLVFKAAGRRRLPAPPPGPLGLPVAEGLEDCLEPVISKTWTWKILMDLLLRGKFEKLCCFGGQNKVL